MSLAGAPNCSSVSDGALSGRLAYAAYDAACVLALLLAIPAAPWWLWRGKGRGLGERLGVLPPAARALGARPLWLHAASVGETRAAAALLRAVRQRRPEIPIVLSATTATGRAVAEADLDPDVATLLPLDAMGIVDRALHALRPRCVVVVETEIWPGFFRAAHRAGAGLIVASGRISERSQRGYRWVAPLVRTALGYVDRFGMQTDADATRILALGAPAERVQVTGSLKAVAGGEDGGPPPLAGIDTRPLLVAASTQPGEEELVLAACAQLWRRHPRAILLIAPRRPERFDEVEACVARAGVRYQRRNQVRGPLGKDTQVLLLDSVGELIRFLPFATAVFVGGTLAPLGGHNVLEPARFGKPVAFGPSLDNVAEAARELCRQQGAVLVHGHADLARHWGQCLDDRAFAAAMGACARAVAAAGSAVLEQTWALIAPYLGEG
jgi:3-deoxy-D-manno-octulosonic-acid transferase